MSGRTALAVIGGGRSCEHEVSLASAAAIVAGLDRDRYEVTALTIGRDGTWSDTSGPLGPTVATSLAAAVGRLGGVEAVVPAIHGPGGEDGVLAALCELAAVPLVGSGVRAGALGMDKWTTKLVAAAVGVPTAAGVLLGPDDPLPRWTGPVVVKPVGAGSSHGVALVREPDAFAGAVRCARRLDHRVLVEEFVVGREIDLAVLAVPGERPRVSPPLEIRLAGPLFDTAAKYDGSAVFQVPAALDPCTRDTLSRAALAVFEALGCAGVARVDFFVRPDGAIVLNEVNTVPGFTEHSQVPRMFAADGLSYPALLDHLVRAALPGRPG